MRRFSTNILGVLLAASIALTLVLSSQDALAAGPSYTLYRNSLAIANARIEVAVFNRQDDCFAAADMFTESAHSIGLRRYRYWCEKFLP